MISVVFLSLEANSRTILQLGPQHFLPTFSQFVIIIFLAIGRHIARDTDKTGSEPLDSRQSAAIARGRPFVLAISYCGHFADNAIVRHRKLKPLPQSLQCSVKEVLLVFQL
jgi:hypothetical protein